LVDLVRAVILKFSDSCYLKINKSKVIRFCKCFLGKRTRAFSYFKCRIRWRK